MFVWLAKLMSAYKFVGTTREPSSHHTISTQESLALARGTRSGYGRGLRLLGTLRCRWLGFVLCCKLGFQVHPLEILARSQPTTRLETRTKESNMYASFRELKPDSVVKTKRSRR